MRFIEAPRALILSLGVVSSAGAQTLAIPQSGVVINATTGAPVDGVEIVVAGSVRAGGRTDAHGRWVVRVPPGPYVASARAIGFLPREIRWNVTSPDSVLTIRLSPSAHDLDQLVITAARREQRLGDVVVTTQLISQSAIEQSGASDLASLLTEQAGIDLQGGHPAGAGVMLQGLGSERVLVLLDGQPIVGRISGVFDVSRIPLSIVERVEIVKGPQSTLYGSEAMGGVVNVITRPARAAFGADASTFAGTQGRLDADVGLTAGRGALAASLDAGRRTTNTAPGRPEESGAMARRLDLSSRIRWAPDSARSVEAAILALDERQRWLTSSYYNFADNFQWTGRVTGAYQHGRQRFAPVLSASSFDHLSRVSAQSRPIAGDTGQRQLQRRYQADLGYGRRLGAAAAHALDAGVTVRVDETESQRIRGGHRTYTSFEPFAQMELAAARRLTVLPGFRLSTSSRWGTQATPRIAARFRPRDALTLRASTGTGFRAPDFKELYMFFQNTAVGYAVIGNEDLRPESSRNVTMGAEWTGARAYLRGQAFWNGFRDFIETRAITAPGQPAVYQYANIASGATAGVDVESAIERRSLKLEASYSGLRTRDQSTGEPLLGRPTHAGRLVATYGVGRSRLSLATSLTGKTPMQRDHTTGAITSWRNSYTRFDVRASQRLRRDLEASAGVDNALNTQPSNWAGFTGRHLYTALTWTSRRGNQ